MKALGLSVLGAGLGVLVLVLALRGGRGAAEPLCATEEAPLEDATVDASLAAPRIERESQEAWVEVRVHPPQGVRLADLGPTVVSVVAPTHVAAGLVEWMSPHDAPARAIGDLGEDGTTRLGPVPAGSYMLLVDPARWGNAQSTFECVAGATATVEVQVPAGFRVQGAVVDEDGRPIPHAHLGLTGFEPDERGDGIVVDALGRFDVGGLSFPRVVIGAWADGFVRETCVVEGLVSGEVRAGVRVVLGRGMSVAGRVVWPDGEPIAGVTVTAQTEAWRDVARVTKLATTPWTSDTAGDGSFRIDRLPRGPYTLEVAPPSNVTTRRQVAASETKGDYRERRAAWLASVKDGPWLGRVTGVEAGDESVVIEVRQSAQDEAR